MQQFYSSIILQHQCGQTVIQTFAFAMKMKNQDTGNDYLVAYKHLWTCNYALKLLHRIYINTIFQDLLLACQYK